MLSLQDISPQQAGQRRTKRGAERTVVDAERHAVHRCPEGAFADGDPILAVDFLPCLDDAREKNRGSDVCSRELKGGQVNEVYYTHKGLVWSTHIAQNHRQKSHPANAAYCSGLVYPVIPSVCKYRYPALGD